jgi:uncharacterized membrane protein YcaP (DUF421 family)
MATFTGLALRALIVYVFMVLVWRLSGKEAMTHANQASNAMQMGSAFNLVVAFTVSDLPDDMIFGSVPLVQGIVAMGTLILLHMLVSYLSLRFAWFNRLVEHRATVLLRDGEPIRRNLTQERISDAELDAALRAHGITDRTELEAVLLETSGAFSVRRRAEQQPAQQSDLTSIKDALL